MTRKKSFFGESASPGLVLKCGVRMGCLEPLLGPDLWGWLAQSPEEDVEDRMGSVVSHPGGQTPCLQGDVMCPPVGVARGLWEKILSQSSPNCPGARDILVPT